MLSWVLPTGWRSVRVRLSGPGGRHDHSVAASSRAMTHPADAWRSGTYTWSVQARNPSGRLFTSAARTYRLLPRLGAWVTSGRIKAGGRSVRLRIGYAASEPSAAVRVRVVRGRTVLHAGHATRRTMHVRGVGSPRRGWFAYTAALRSPLRAGQRIVVEVRVTAGGRTLARRFTATAR
jgi:hypothetical protein